MSKNMCRMIGLLTELISVFFLIGGLYFGGTGLPAFVVPICLVVGLILLVTGIVFYHILKKD